MDINTKTLQHQAAVTTSLKADNIKQAVDPSVKSVADSSRKTETQSAVSNGEKVASVSDKEKAAKESEDLKQAVSKLNDYVQTIQRNLQFTIDKESGITIVKVIDTKSEKVIRQIPSEETIKLARSLVEQNDDKAISLFSSRA